MLYGTALTEELAVLPPEVSRVLLATGNLVGEGFDHPALVLGNCRSSGTTISLPHMSISARRSSSVRFIGAVGHFVGMGALTEKRMLQIMRVQIALTRLELYRDQISGTLDAGTKSSLKMFQRIKGLPESGLMTTETLNGLGVMGVQ